MSTSFAGNPFNMLTGLFEKIIEDPTEPDDTEKEKERKRTEQYGLAKGVAATLLVVLVVGLSIYTGTLPGSGKGILP